MSETEFTPVGESLLPSLKLDRFAHEKVKFKSRTMSWSLEDRDGQMYIYRKGSVQLQWDHVEKISALFAKLKGSQSGKKFQLLQMMRQRQQHFYKSSLKLK